MERHAAPLFRVCILEVQSTSPEVCVSVVIRSMLFHMTSIPVNLRRNSDMEAAEALSLRDAAEPKLSKVVCTMRGTSRKRQARRKAMVSLHSPRLRHKGQRCDCRCRLGPVEEEHGGALQVRTSCPRGRLWLARVMVDFQEFSRVVYECLGAHFRLVVTPFVITVIQRMMLVQEHSKNRAQVTEVGPHLSSAARKCKQVARVPRIGSGEGRGGGREGRTRRHGRTKSTASELRPGWSDSHHNRTPAHQRLHARALHLQHKELDRTDRQQQTSQNEFMSEFPLNSVRVSLSMQCASGEEQVESDCSAQVEPSSASIEVAERSVCRGLSHLLRATFA